MILNYFKTYGYKTEVMGASLRNIDEIIELAGCDLLTISPKLLEQLKHTKFSLTKKLDSLKPELSQEKITMDKAKFDSLWRF